MNSSNDIYKRRINKVIDYVNNNLSRTLSLDELANVAHFSPYHFHRVFMAITGESLNFFTNRLRLEKAAKMLKFSSNSVNSISIECGFSSASTLSRSFKKYFGISPSTYKKTGEIENSKICKELFPIMDYLVPMTKDELKAAFPVTTKKLPKRRIAFFRVANSFQEGVVIKAFEKLILWAKSNNLYNSETFFGMSMDDPLTTPQDKYRYEVCMTLPLTFAIKENDDIMTMEIPDCQYATTTISGDLSIGATATHYLYNNWLINSKYEPDHQFGLEIFLNKENICDWSHLDLELCIPIRKLKSY